MIASAPVLETAVAHDRRIRKNARTLVFPMEPAMPQPIDLPDSSNTASASRTAIAWRHMVGLALLWLALATLVHLATGEREAYTAWLAVGGFLAFAAGVSLVASALRRAIVQDVLRAQQQAPGASHARR